MSLLRQTQNLAACVVVWDGIHRNADCDLLVSDRIPAKRIGTLTHWKPDVLVQNRRRLCGCGRGFLITGHRLACWRCVMRHQ